MSECTEMAIKCSPPAPDFCFPHPDLSCQSSDFSCRHSGHKLASLTFKPPLPWLVI